jgi:nitrite reductase/ring-hydroxylating ferredoxin subunit/uncharacterized membrane protein
VADTLVDAASRQRWLDPLADGLTQFVREAYGAAGAAGATAKNLMHGVWLGHPLHPVLTDIPVGAWTTALVLDAVEASTGDEAYGRGADVAVATGLVGAAGAAVSGLTDWSETDGAARRVGLVHGLLNVAATSMFLTSYVMRRRGARAGGRTCAAIGFAIAGTAAYLGGNLVYRDRIGVTHADQGAPDDFVRVMASSELGEGDKRCVDVGGTSVAVIRQHGKVCALAHHCSHLGGPLADGELKEGSVVCPWHGSEFAIDDGRVINGPATHPQPCYEVRERDGGVEIGPARK